MISWLMSSCHNKDILNYVNFALKVSYKHKYFFMFMKGVMSCL